MISIDNAGEIVEKDPQGMLGMTDGFPDQLQRARSVQTRLQTKHAHLRKSLLQAGESPRDVVVCGMGGSAIGAEFAAAWAADRSVRLHVHRGYGLPSWVGPQHLLVFSSYSGNTEETLSAFEASRGPRRVCITTGGSLAQFAGDERVAVIELPGGLQPRAALGHSLVAQLLLLELIGAVEADVVSELEDCGRFLRGLADKLSPEVAESENPAKQLARLFHGVLPFLLSGSGLMQPVATRWKGQLNENAKSLAVTSVLPEMNHNEIMAWTALPEIRGLVRLFFLRDHQDAEPVKKRMQVTADLIGARVAGVEWLDTRGESVLERMLSASFLGDYASCYLAFLNRVDPTPVAQIDELKRRLAQS